MLKQTMLDGLEQDKQKSGSTLLQEQGALAIRLMTFCLPIFSLPPFCLSTFCLSTFWHFAY
jgi:hypothetical protein